MSKEKLIELGYSSRPHGIKGGFSLVLHNPNESILAIDMDVLLVPSSEKSSLGSEGEAFKIAKIQIGHKSIVYFEGIEDRNIVENMLPFKLMVNRSQFPVLEAGEFYLSDLIGLEAFNESDKRVGEVVSMYDNGAQTIVVIETKNKDKLEIPLVDNFFLSIDVENNKVIVRPPELI